MSKSQKKFASLELPYVFLALILPLAYTLTWLLLNTQLPGNDAANYLMTSTSIFHHFTDHGFWKGLHSVFSERGWRPIFFPVLTVPFQLLSHGNLYFSYFSVSLLCLIASVIYIYFFLRLKLDNYSAIIATSLIGLLPFIQAQIVMFYAEAALFPCVIGCIYHLIQSDYLRCKKHVYGFMLLLTLAFWIRPVEAVTHLMFILALFLFLGWHSRNFSVRQIISVVLISLSALFLMLLFSALPYIHFVPVHVIDGGMFDIKMTKVIRNSLFAAAGCVFIVGIVLAFTQIKLLAQECWNSFYRDKETTLLVPAFFIVTLLVLMWFLPFAHQTFEWVYRTSLGDVASSTGSLSGSHFSWNVLYIYLRDEGIVPVVSTIIIAAVAFVCLTSRQKCTILLSTPFIYLLLLLPFPIWEAFYTVQIVTRKLSIAVPALLMALLMLALQNGKLWKSRFVSVVILTGLVFGLNVALMLSPISTSQIPFLNHTIGYFVPKPARLKPNPHDLVMDFLTQQAAKYHLTSIAIELDPGTPDARHPVEAQPVDPFLLSTMALASKRPYAVGYPYVSLYAPHIIKSFSDKYDAIFLSDLSSKMVKSKKASVDYVQQYQAENNASLKVLYEFLSHYSSNTLARLGWKVGPCINLQGERGGEYIGCLLLHKAVKG